MVLETNVDVKAKEIYYKTFKHYLYPKLTCQL
jgi:hypothetical protein